MSLASILPDNYIGNSIILAQEGNKPGATVCGMLALVFIGEVAVITNVGWPPEFRNPAGVWTNTYSTAIDQMWTDINEAWANNAISTDWIGKAKDVFTGYVTTDLKDAFTALKKLSDDLGQQLNTVGGAVQTMDIACLVYTVVSTAFIIALTALDVETAGTITPALMAAFCTYLLGLGTWVAALVVMFNAFSNAAMTLTQDANAVKAKLFDSNKQPRLKIPDYLSNYQNWKYNPVLDSKP
jgi:uncharacterized protein YukE